MKIISLILTALIASAPALWLPDYNLINPVWWTVMAVWGVGTIHGWMINLGNRKDEEEK